MGFGTLSVRISSLGRSWIRNRLFRQLSVNPLQDDCSQQSKEYEDTAVMSDLMTPNLGI